jgi:phosphoglycerate dehydrogenase-like enzyme
MNTEKERLKIALLVNKYNYERTFHPDDLDFLKTFASLLNEGEAPDTIDESFMKEALRDADVCITCWGTPAVTKAVLDGAPALKLIAHAAGTPKAIVSDSVWDRGIRVFTAAPVIAIDVAETALGAIIYMQKRMSQFDAIVRSGIWARDKSKVDDQKPYMKRINYRLKIGIIGASHVGKNLIRLLKPFGAKIMLFDPCVSSFAASQMGVEKASLEELVSQCDVVTLHAPNLPQTYHMVDQNMLARMKDGALFVNTSRGPVVDEKALIEELKSGRLYAYLDVFDNEPLPEASPLYNLENVLLSPHISGGHTANGGFERGNYVIQQIYRYYMTGILKDEALKDMLGNMA